MKTAYALVLMILIISLACHSSRRAAQLPVPAYPEKKVDSNPTVLISSARTDSFMVKLLQRYPAWFDSITRHADSLRVQIIYTRIDRKPDNSPEFSTFYYHVDPSQYFYPASTVKMPVALLALEKLREWNKAGIDPNTTMITESAYGGQTPVFNDPTTPDGRPSVAQYIRKIFLVSDNDAFNRLYELVGQQQINERLHAKGFRSAEILHRLATVLTADQNRHTNPIRFVDAAGRTVYQQPMQESNWLPAIRKDYAGHAYAKGDSIVPAPLDFSMKNRISLEDLHLVLRSIIFPQAVPPAMRFNISPDDYRFVWKYMSQFPTETLWPPYASDSSFYDAYCKFVYYGAERKKLPKTFRIFNKVGDAYGFLTDVAYVVDFEKNIEFMVSATIFCDRDGTLNDNHYDYDGTGFPFMKHLGQALYEYEASRPRTRIPDLSAFRLTYDR